MFIKLIEVEVIPNHMDAFMQSQTIWNEETRKASGSIGYFTGVHAEEENFVTLIFFWVSEHHYQKWMADEHDRIAELTGANDHYAHLNIKFIESSLKLPSAFINAEIPNSSVIDFWSEAKS